MSRYLGAGILVLALAGLGACSVKGEFPSLADIPSAPATATDMEEKRRIVEEMSENAVEEEAAAEDVNEDGEATE
jgi:hypothetical protein